MPGGSFRGRRPGAGTVYFRHKRAYNEGMTTHPGITVTPIPHPAGWAGQPGATEHLVTDADGFVLGEVYGSDGDYVIYTHESDHDERERLAGYTSLDDAVGELVGMFG